MGTWTHFLALLKSCTNIYSEHKEGWALELGRIRVSVLWSQVSSLLREEVLVGSEAAQERA